MSIKCPKCGTELTQDFGLVSCSGCASVLSVDVDGNVQLASEDFHQKTATHQAYEEPAPLNQFADSHMEQIPEQNSQAFEPIPEPAAEPVFEQTEEVPTEPTLEPPAEIYTEQSQEHMTEPAEVAREVTSTWAEPKSAIQEIREFGNKEAPTGPISYSILIDNVDLPDRAQEVLQALSDPKFGWDRSTLVSQLKNGQLQLDNLNPAIAVMVIKKLRGIHVQVSWTQSLYS